MKANQELINAFRQVAHNLEFQPHIWEWGCFSHCNCGLVAQQLGLPETTLMSATKTYADWAHFSQRLGIDNLEAWNTTCPTTNMDIQDVILTLQHYGLSPNDMIDLELCLDEREDTVEELINYFRETADRLEVELLNKSAEVQKENQPVSVSVSV